MTEIPVPDITGWPQAFVVLGVIGYLCWKAWLDSGRTKETNQKVKDLESTLTTTNGGSHVKDQLNRIEKSLGEVKTDVGEVSGRVTVLEQQRRGWLRR